MNVTWDDAQAFCRWLTQQEGGRRQYRLPTEAEWEYACRAGRQGEDSKYPWGGSWPPSGRAGNHVDESTRAFGWVVIQGYNDGQAVTAPVGSFDANPWGLHDMGGNVWEWCSDWYDANYCRTQATDPQGATTGSGRVLRGSAWGFSVRDSLRSAYRDFAPPSYPRDVFGFRVVVAGAGSRL